MEAPALIEESEPKFRAENQDQVSLNSLENRTESIGSDVVDSCYVPRLRPNEFIVYKRNKRLKSGGNENEGSVGSSDQLQEHLENFPQAAGAEILNGEGQVPCRKEGNLDADERVNAGGIEGDLGLPESKKDDCKMTAVEAKEELAVVLAKTDATIKCKRSVLLTKSDDSEIGNISSGELMNEEVLERKGPENEDLDRLETPMKTPELKISKKAVIDVVPTTVKELFETRLLEGYPVVYNGGKRGFPLRGVVKETGILCSCSLCKGSRVIPPCQFEIHACKSYRRASQYICFENGKSLLDIVKECQNSSLNMLEEKIQNLIGPLPAKESMICLNCKGSFLATSPRKRDQLCNLCTGEISEAHAGAKLRAFATLPDLTSSETEEIHSNSERKVRGGKKRKHFELTANSSSPEGSLSLVSTRNKNQWTKTMKSSRMTSGSPLANLSKSASSVNATESTSSSRSLKNTSRRKISKRLSRMPLKSASSLHSAQKNSWKITRKDQTMHKIVFEKGGLPDGTEVAYYSNGKKLREGYKLGSGIFCRCCDDVVSASQFEAHAGWASRKKPYMYIYTSNGVSLHEFAISLVKARKHSNKKSDDWCCLCADGGNLLLCDACPRVFHKECASVSSLPKGKWYCPYCENMFQREKFVEHNANAVAAGRVAGVDLIEQITNRCIRIVSNPGKLEVISCVICRGYDYSKSGFGPLTVILCDQCEKEYHVGCLKEREIADLKELPEGKWLCSVDCEKIYSTLQNVVSSGAEKLSDSSLGIIRKKQKENGSGLGNDLDVRWRLLNAKVSSADTRVLLSQAVALFHECFDPIVDAETGRDFIPAMVHGKSISGQDFRGMYCAILTVNSSVVSAGILRIFGPDIAELPLVATSLVNQRKGYFQILYSCIEKLLAFLNVKTFVLPAAEEAKSIWIDKFGFHELTQEQLDNYRQTCWQMVSFKGTSMLSKPVPKCRIINEKELEAEVDTDTDAEAEVDADADAEAEVEADAEVEVDADANAEAEPDAPVQ